jgi:UDP-2,3-diacylglucosamine hydrolase
VALYLMHGNRDFLVGERFCAATGAKLLADPERARDPGACAR